MQPTEKKKDSLSIVALIGANLIPLVGIFLFDWDVIYIVILYWAENLIVGLFNILKMTTVKMLDQAGNLGKLFLIPFFCVHYGGFCAVHGLFLTVFFKISPGSSPFDSGSYWWGPLVFVQLLFSVIAKVWSSQPPEMKWALLGLTASHGVSFVENFILGREYERTDLKSLMHQPYQRIIVMHIAILAGGVLVMRLNSPMPLMMILVCLKIFFDIHLHRKSHKAIESKAVIKKDVTEQDAKGIA